MILDHDAGIRGLVRRPGVFEKRQTVVVGGEEDPAPAPGRNPDHVTRPTAANKATPLEGRILATTCITCSGSVTGGTIIMGAVCGLQDNPVARKKITEHDSNKKSIKISKLAFVWSYGRLREGEATVGHGLEGPDP